MIELDFPKEVKAVKFGSWTLNPRRHILSDEKIELELELLLYKILAFLILHRERIVTRDELITEVWQQKYVDNNAINRALSELRKALKSERQRGLVIKTHYRKGYSFILDVEIVEYDQAIIRGPNTQGVSDVEVKKIFPEIDKKRNVQFEPIPINKYKKTIKLGFAFLIALVLATICFVFYPSSQESIEYIEKPLTWGEGSAKNVVIGSEKLIAYEYKRHFSLLSEIRVTNVELNTTIVLSDQTADMIPLTWSEDGLDLYYQLKREGQCEVWVAEFKDVKQNAQHKKVFDCQKSIIMSATLIGKTFIYTKFGFRGKQLVASLFNRDLNSGYEYRITTPSSESLVGDFFVTRLITTNESKIIFIRKDKQAYQLFISSTDGSKVELIHSSENMIYYVQQLGSDLALQWSESGIQYYFNIQTKQKERTYLSENHSFYGVYELNEKYKIINEAKFDLDIVQVDIINDEVQKKYDSGNIERMSTTSYEGREILVTQSDKDYVWLVSTDSQILITSYKVATIQDIALSHDGKLVFITSNRGFEIIKIDGSEVLLSQLHFENVLSGIWFENNRVYLLQGVKEEAIKNLILINLSTYESTVTEINADFKIHKTDDKYIYFKTNKNEFKKIELQSNSVETVFTIEDDLLIIDWLIKGEELFYALLDGLYSVNLNTNHKVDYKSLDNNLIMRLINVVDNTLSITMASDKKSDLILLERKK